MKETNEAAAAVAITLAAEAVTRGVFNVDAMWESQNRAIGGIYTSGPSVTKSVMKIRELIDGIGADESSGFLECCALLADVGEGRGFELLSDTQTPRFSFRDALNIADLEADSLLEAEARMKGQTKNIRLTPTIVEWIEETARKIADIMMEAGDLQSIRQDPAGDFRLFTTASLGMQTLDSKLMTLVEQKKDTSGSHFQGSSRLMEAHALVRTVFTEVLLQPLFDRLSAQDRSAWFKMMHTIANRIVRANANQILRIKNWSIENAASAGYQNGVRTQMLKVNALMSSLAEPSLHALECRSHALRLADLLRPLITRDAPDEEIAPWETELPFGEVLLSEKLPGGERVYFVANGSFDVSTVNVRQADVSPFLESQLTFQIDTGYPSFVAHNALSSTVRFGDQVCPGDVYASVRPFAADDPVRQTLLLADKALRKKLNDIWCDHPDFIRLATTASPLCIVHDGLYSYVACHIKGEKELHDLFGKYGQKVDAVSMATEYGLQLTGRQREMVALRIPTSILIPPVIEKPLETVIHENREQDSSSYDRPQSVRALLQQRLGAPSVSSYHAYIGALRRSGVSERPANGSHIALYTPAGGFALHSHAFRDHASSPVNLGYVARELRQLRINPEVFLIELGY